MIDNFKEIAEEAAGEGLEGFEYLARLQKFYHDNCEKCGLRRCLGVYDKDRREDCELFKEEFKDIIFL